jgi:hypothetical protein
MLRLPEESVPFTVRVERIVKSPAVEKEVLLDKRFVTKVAVDTICPIFAVEKLLNEV